MPTVYHLFTNAWEQILCKDLSTPTVFHVGEDQRIGLALCEGPHD